MAASSTILHLRRDEINDVLWNRCVDEATNGLIYAYTYYLDHLAKQWDGLVLGNYEAVMPLPWRKRYGLSYLFHPPLTAQLGLFGKKINGALLNEFLHAIPRKFRYWDFPMNHQNIFATDFPLYERSNYVLPLQEDYGALSKGYRENIRRNVRKSQELGCTIKQSIEVGPILSLALEQSGDGDAAVDGDAFVALFDLLEKKEMARTYGVFSNRDELLASCVFFFSHGRAYYILVGNHPNGRTLGASHALIDGFIRDHAGKELLLDFEGSDLRNLAFFYSSFGAQLEKYAAIRMNRLPWYARWVKE
jgi:hypothetical protein